MANRSQGSAAPVATTDLITADDCAYDSVQRLCRGAHAAIKQWAAGDLDAGVLAATLEEAGRSIRWWNRHASISAGKHRAAEKAAS